MAPSRQLRLGAFMRPATIHTGAWRYPGAFPDANFNFAHLKRFAQTLERGKFDAFFMADHLAVLNMPLDALKRSHTVTSFEPFTLLSALAGVTEHLGLVATGSTTFDTTRLTALVNELGACGLMTQAQVDAFTNSGDITAINALLVQITPSQPVLDPPDTLDDGSTVAGERILVATGRRIDLAALGTGSVGIDVGGKFIPVDDHLRAGERLWAVGDVTGQGAFTHVAVYQGRIAAADILGEDVAPARYHALPRVTFTDPEIGAVGLTEAQARDRGVAVRTGVASVPSSARGWIHKVGNDGFTKLVEDAGRGVLIGATAAGPVGGEVLGLLALAVHAEVPTDELRQMIYAYPTFHRGIEDALTDLRAG